MIATRMRHSLGSWWRRHWPWASPSPVQWLYSDRYNVELRFFAADLARGERILSHLDRLRLIDPGDLHWPRRASMRKLRLVHDDRYLRLLQSRRAVERVVGSRLPPGKADDVVLGQRAMVGGTLVATRLALDHDWIMVNLGGGLHHARADQGQGFCLFNDVAIAIRHQRARGFRGPILVIDLDLHDGDGTRSIFADDSTVFTLSIHNQPLGSTDAVADRSVALGGDVDDATYLATVREEVLGALGDHRPELVFYLAGTDVAADDKLGNWAIGPEALFERDRFVVESVRGLEPTVPLVITLAGGYGLRAWRHSARFLAWLRAGRRMPEPPPTDDLPLPTYRRLSRLLSVPQPRNREEGGLGSLGLSEADLPGVSPPQSRRFLGRYTVHGIELALEKSGVLDRIRHQGFESLHLEAELVGETGQTLRLISSQPRREVLLELRARRDRNFVEGLEVIFVEWLLSQNPRAEFLVHRPELPGQQHPGLGLLRDVVSMLWVGSEALGLDGFGFVPSHVALALQAFALAEVIESGPRRELAGVVVALKGQSLVEKTRAIEEGRVRRYRDGEVYRYEPVPMLVPVSARARDWVREQFHEGEPEAYELVAGSD